MKKKNMFRLNASVAFCLITLFVFLNQSCSTVVQVADKVDKTVNRAEDKFQAETEKKHWKAVAANNPRDDGYKMLMEAMRYDSMLNTFIGEKGMPEYLREENGALTHLAYPAHSDLYVFRRLLDGSPASLKRVAYTRYRDLPAHIRDAFAVGALPEKRLALVIGNAGYPPQLGRLSQPLNDARAMAATLRRLGFEVRKYENCSRAMMEQAIADFGKQLASYSVRLVYYSGHGMQAEGKNYLIPVDAQIQTPHDVRYEGIRLQRVFEQVKGGVGATNLIILDACRNNPFAWLEKGLAEVDAPKNVLVAYAAAPGKFAFEAEDVRNGFYTGTLLEHLATPNISVSRLFQQVRAGVWRKTAGMQLPWETTSLTKPFYFMRD